MTEQEFCAEHRCARALCEDAHSEHRNVYPRAAGEHADCAHDDDGITADDTGRPLFNGPSTPGGPVPDGREYYLMIRREGDGYDVDGHGDPLVAEPGP